MGQIIRLGRHHRSGGKGDVGVEVWSGVRTLRPEVSVITWLSVVDEEVLWVQAEGTVVRMRVEVGVGLWRDCGQ